MENKTAYQAKLIWWGNFINMKPSKKYEKLRKQWDKWMSWRRKHNNWDF